MLHSFVKNIKKDIRMHVKKKSDFSSLYASRAIMKLGSKVNWKDALYATTGYSEYRIEPFLAYYEPVREWLQREIERHKIPVGWN